MAEKTEQIPVGFSITDPGVEALYEDMRKAGRGKTAVFLGAGASFDYGIPTMIEIASELNTMITDDNPQMGVSEDTLNLLKMLISSDTDKEGPDWDIEQLLTRIQYLLHAFEGGCSQFQQASMSIAEDKLNKELLQKASNELTGFMVEMCELTGKAHSSHGSGSVKYLSDFIEVLSTFDNALTIFTTNLDVCFEAAVARLSQRNRVARRPDFILLDGFSNGLVSTFDLHNYRRELFTGTGKYPIYYWKLHGSVDWTYSQPLDYSVEDESDQIPANNDGFSDDSIIIRRIGTQQWDDLHNCSAISKPSSNEKSRRVIFPTPLKYLQTYTFPYMDLFEAFRRTLEEIELLIVVGTSFPDQHIRSAIKSFTQRDSTLLYVIDPGLSRDALKSIFGDVKTIQNPVVMGFEQFIKQFIKLEKLQDDELETSEDEGEGNE